MDIRQLKYFMAIAEEGQITSAARKLQMAQLCSVSSLSCLRKN